MRFTWDEQNIEWFLSASVYTGFHKALAEKLLKYIKPGDTLCDVGCGLGRLDLELAPHVKRLTAIDISEIAIGVLRRDAAALGLANIDHRIGDSRELTGDYDVLLLSFFGQPNVPDYNQLSFRRMLRVVNAENRSGLYPERHRYLEKDTVPVVRAELEEKGVKFTIDADAIEFGQPLRSGQDAARFVLQNAPEADAGEISDFLGENLIATGRDDFPFYLPNKKELAVFVIDID